MGGWTSKDIPSQAGKVAIVTGANSGIGFETAVELGRAGAHVILACRDEGRGNKALEEMKKQVPTGSFELQLVDLSSLASVKAFCDRIIAKDQPIDLLINNAGVACPNEYTVSTDGFEIQIAANHLGHFAMTGQLLPLLQRSTKQPRVVSVSSPIAWGGSIKTLDFIGDKSWNTSSFYGHSKLMNLAFTWELNKRYGGEGPGKIVATAAHPGGTATNLANHMKGASFMSMMMQTPAMGALPTLRAATDPTLQANAYMAPRGFARGYPVRGIWPPQGYNDALTAKLWTASVEATKLKY